MTGLQKAIAVFGLVAIAFFAYRAPYVVEYQNNNPIQGSRAIATQPVTAPFWSPPDTAGRSTALFAEWERRGKPEGDPLYNAWMQTKGVRLDSQRLWLSWGASLLVSILLILIVAPRKRAG